METDGTVESMTNELSELSDAVFPAVSIAVRRTRQALAFTLGTVQL